jgi:hypothetical protein
MKHAPFMGQIYIGDTLLDVYGYGRHEIEDIMVAETNESVWEMIHALNPDYIKKNVDQSLFGV